MKRQLGLALLNIWHKALKQTRPVSGALTVVAQHLQTPHTHWGCALGDIDRPRSAVLWISIPATASIVAPQRRKKERRKTHDLDHDL